MRLAPPGRSTEANRSPDVEGMEDGSRSSDAGLDELHEDGLVGTRKDQTEDGLPPKEQPEPPGKHRQHLGRGETERT